MEDDVEQAEQDGGIPRRPGAEDTLAARSEASVPPGTATIMTFLYNPRPILSPTKARMFPALAC